MVNVGFMCQVSLKYTLYVLMMLLSKAELPTGSRCKSEPTRA